MKTINKMLAAALMLVSTQSVFAAPNLPIKKPVEQPQKDIVRLMKVKNAQDNIIWVNILDHYVGSTFNGTSYSYHYQLAVDLTHDGVAVSDPSPYSFSVDLYITTIAGEPAANAQDVQMVIYSGGSSSSFVDVYSDHPLTSSDVVNYKLATTVYEDYTIELNHTPITE